MLCSVNVFSDTCVCNITLEVRKRSIPIPPKTNNNNNNNNKKPKTKPLLFLFWHGCCGDIKLIEIVSVIIQPSFVNRLNYYSTFYYHYHLRCYSAFLMSVIKVTLQACFPDNINKTVCDMNCVLCLCSCSNNVWAKCSSASDSKFVSLSPVFPSGPGTRSTLLITQS